MYLMMTKAILFPKAGLDKASGKEEGADDQPDGAVAETHQCFAGLKNAGYRTECES